MYEIQVFMETSPNVGQWTKINTTTDDYFAIVDTARDIINNNSKNITKVRIIKIMEIFTLEIL
jgi:hypothetical protein